MQLKTHKLVFVFFLFISFISCDEYRVFDSYKAVGLSGWEKEDLVSFQFEISDTLTRHDLYIQIRNTNEYEYSNLFLITEFQYPNGFHEIDTLEYKMTDIYGKWLGEGFTDIKENKLYFKGAFQFPGSGEYEINIQQAMRKRDYIEGILSVKGISDVGFRIEKSVK
jgi:gliding motility-associated lipoprotein GldH